MSAATDIRVFVRFIDPPPPPTDSKAQEDDTAETMLPLTRLFEFSTSPNLEVDAMKYLIGTRTSIKVEDQFLVFNGLALEEGKRSLEEYGVKDNSYITMVSLSAKHDLNSIPDLNPLKSLEESKQQGSDIDRLLDEVVKPELLEPLLEMGFSEFRARKALLLNFLNAQLALEWLFQHSEDVSIDTPLTPHAKLRIARVLGIDVKKVSPDIEKCIASNRCTFSLTGSRYAPQEFYLCLTCNLTNGRGCCVACASICHKSHQLSKIHYSDSFFCDCGSGDAPLPCQALNRIDRHTTMNHKNLASKQLAETEFKRRKFLSDSHVDVSTVISDVKPIWNSLSIQEQTRVESLVQFIKSSEFCNQNPKPNLEEPSSSLSTIRKILKMSKMKRPVVALWSALVLLPSGQEEIRMDVERNPLRPNIVNHVCSVASDQNQSESWSHCMTFFLNMTSSQRLSNICKDMASLFLESAAFCTAFKSSAPSERLNAVSLVSNLALLSEDNKDHVLSRSVVAHLLTLLAHERHNLLISEAILSLAALLYRCPNFRNIAIAMGTKDSLRKLKRIETRKIGVHATMLLNMLEAPTM